MRTPIDHRLPLLPIQAGMLMRESLARHGRMFHQVLFVALDAAMPLDRATTALQRLVDRHDALRTTICGDTRGEPMQSVAAHARLALSVLADPVPGAALDRLQAAVDQVDLPLTTPPLRVLAAHDAADDRWRLALVLHHAMIDQASAALLWREFLRMLGEPAVVLPPPHVLVLRPRSAMQAAGDAAFFRQRLEAIDMPRLMFSAALAGAPAGMPRRTARLPLDACLNEAVLQVARRLGVTAAAVFHAAWALVASRASGGDDVVFGTVLSLRSGRRELRAVGALINTVPLALRLRELGVDALLRRVQNELNGSRQHAWLSLADAQRASATTPLFNAVINCRLRRATKLRTGAHAEVLDWREGSDVPLLLSIDQFGIGDGSSDGGEGFELIAQCAEPLDPDRVLRFMHTALRALCAADASSPALQIDVLPSDEGSWIAAQGAGPVASERVDTAVGVHELVMAQAAHTPEAMALVEGNQSIRYRELADEAMRLSRRLAARGVRPGARVVVCMPRGAAQVIAVVGSMVAGAACVPLDATLPAERLALLIADAGAAAVVTVAAWRADVQRLAPAGTPMLMMDAAQEDADARPQAARADDAAYLVYTSGSTGAPKGVLVPHRGLLNLVRWERAAAQGEPVPRTAHTAALGFDVALQEVFGTLCFGGCLVVVPDEARRDPVALLRLLDAQRIERLYLPTVALARVAEAFAHTRTPIPALRDVIVAGEALQITPEIADLFIALPQCRLHNHYGPSETHVVTAFTLPGTPRLWVDAWAQPPIGQPIAGVRVHLLDAAMRPVPMGVAGEIVIGGAAVGLGYHGSPELSAERFIPDVFSGVPGERLYRTGDIGRWRADGRIDYLGRDDRQLKIRGHRVEPGEIEAHLKALPGLRDAAVIGWADASGEQRLAAYLVAGDERQSFSQLRETLAQSLPDPMLPTSWNWLDRLPLTSSGKLDRLALPPPQTLRPDLVAGATAERVLDPLEAALARLWGEVLPAAPVRTDDHFFHLGGHSLDATRLASRIRVRLGVELPLREIFAHPQLGAMASALRHRCASEPDADSAHPALRPIRHQPRDQALPASHSQRRMWLVQQLQPHTTAYNVPFVLRLRGPLDRQRLADALGHVTRRHEAFRTRLVIEDGELVQRIGKAADTAPAFFDLEATPATMRESEAARLLGNLSRHPFDLAAGHASRVSLIRLGPQDHVLMWLMHHAISDQWSGGILLREFGEAYTALAAGRTPHGPAMSIGYADYAAWQQEPAHEAALAPQLQFWREHLQGLQPLALWVDKPRHGLPSGDGGSLVAPMPSALIARLRSFSAEHGATPFMTLLACFQLLLARYSGQQDVAVGAPIANRHRLESEHLVGTLVNTLVMRTDCAGNPRFDELLARVRETALSAYANQDVPFERLVETLAPRRQPHPTHHAPLVQVLFNVVNAPLGPRHIGDLTLEAFPFDRGASQFDLSLTVDTEMFGQVHLEYAGDVFERATAERLLANYLGLVAQVLADPLQAIGSYRIVSPAEQALIASWNQASERPRSVDMRVDQLISHATASHTDAWALRGAAPQGIERLRHGELDARANRLARLLRAKGIARGDRVGLSAAREPDMLVAMLAIWKAGAAYVPLDPGYPAERLAFMAADAGLTLLVGDPAPWWPGPVLPLITARREMISHDDTPLAADAERDATPTDAAYLIYTSGSTGQPKGVVVPHAAVVNFLQGMQERPGLKATDKLLAVTTLSFDIAVLELLLPLCTGAEIVLATREQARDATVLRWLIESSGATAMQATPSTWRMLIESGWKGSPTFKAMVGGETLAPDLADGLLLRCGAVWNLYGPTETTVWSTAERISRQYPGISIGTPIANTAVWILDDALQPCPIGVAGEICIGGAGVADGYRGQGAFTAERFIADPFNPGLAARLYRTGDLGRWRHDARLEHLGRLDAQIKLRGHRIEPGEIEACLTSHPQVRECLVVAREDQPGDMRLVAYIAVDEADAPTDAALTQHLRSRLPEALCPSHLMRLPALPRLPNGKIDRLRLPAPQAQGASALRVSVPDDVPFTRTERRLAAIWQRALGGTTVQRHDNFLDLGGHSLLAVSVLRQMAVQLGVQVTLQQLIYESLAQTAAECDRQLATLRPPPLRPPPRVDLPSQFADSQV